MDALLKRRLRYGVILVIAYAALLYLLVFYYLNVAETLPIVAGFLLLPALIAIAMQVVLDPFLRWTNAQRILYPFALMGALLLGLLIWEVEAIMCVVIAAPIFAVSSLIGTGIAAMILRRANDGIMRASLLVLPLVLLPFADAVPVAVQDHILETRIIIDATPEQIYPQTLNLRDIQRGELPWTLSHNILRIPVPEHAELGADGARHMRWSHGISFQEVQTEREENRRAKWDFHFEPDAIPAHMKRNINPDSRYLKVQSGEYILNNLGDGRTELILRSTYQLRLPMAWYFDAWGRVVLNDIHWAVLTVIKQRSEA